MPECTITISPSLLASIPFCMVAKGFSEEPSPVSSEPVVATCIVVAKENDYNSMISKYLFIETPLII